MRQFIRMPMTASCARVWIWLQRANRLRRTRSRTPWTSPSVGDAGVELGQSVSRDRPLTDGISVCSTAGRPGPGVGRDRERRAPRESVGSTRPCAAWACISPAQGWPRGRGVGSQGRGPTDERREAAQAAGWHADGEGLGVKGLGQFATNQLGHAQPGDPSGQAGQQPPVGDRVVPRVPWPGVGRPGRQSLLEGEVIEQSWLKAYARRRLGTGQRSPASRIRASALRWRYWTAVDARSNWPISV